MRRPYAPKRVCTCFPGVVTRCNSPAAGCRGTHRWATTMRLNARATTDLAGRQAQHIRSTMPMVARSASSACCRRMAVQQPPQSLPSRFAEMRFGCRSRRLPATSAPLSAPLPDPGCQQPLPPAAAQSGGRRADRLRTRCQGCALRRLNGWPCGPNDVVRPADWSESRRSPIMS